MKSRLSWAGHVSKMGSHFLAFTIKGYKRSDSRSVWKYSGASEPITEMIDFSQSTILSPPLKIPTEPLSRRKPQEVEPQYFIINAWPNLQLQLLSVLHRTCLQLGDRRHFDLRFTTLNHIYIYIYILSSTERLFRYITTLQWGFICSMLQVGIETLTTLR